MSIVLITFPAAPKPVKEDMEREKKFEEHIEKRTLGKSSQLFTDLNSFKSYYFALEILNDDPHAEASRILQILNDEDIPDQPQLSVLGAK